MVLNQPVTIVTKFINEGVVEVRDNPFPEKKDNLTLDRVCIDCSTTRLDLRMELTRSYSARLVLK